MADMGGNHGYTLVELIMTMVIVGILSVVAAPRFFDNNAFQERGAIDQVQAALRYGQKVAIAQNRPVNVTITAAASSDCGITLVASAVNCVISNSVSLTHTIPSAAIEVTFDSLGKPYSNVTTALSPPNNTITVGGIEVKIEQETGYVHVN